MPTNKTFDGLTAGFVAAIANTLDRNIDPDRMKELVALLDKMRLLLLPLVDDHLIELVPILARRDILSGHERLCWYYLGGGSSSNPPTMKMVMREARERKYAPLSKNLADKLCALATTHPSPHYQVGITFIYLDQGRLWMKSCDTGLGVPGEHTLVDLDKINAQLMGRRFVFVEGYGDRSNCFKVD